VNFNDDYYLDTEHDFTSNINEMKEALERIDARGSTALYDAIIGSLDHLKKAHRDKRVLLVITDGMDNASRHTLTETINEVQHSDAVIYTVGLFGKEDKARRLERLARRWKIWQPRRADFLISPEAVEDTDPSARKSHTTSATNIRWRIIPRTLSVTELSARSKLQ